MEALFGVARADGMGGLLEDIDFRGIERRLVSELRGGREAGVRWKELRRLRGRGVTRRASGGGSGETMVRTARPSLGRRWNCRDVWISAGQREECGGCRLNAFPNKNYGSQCANAQQENC